MRSVLERKIVFFIYLMACSKCFSEITNGKHSAILHRYWVAYYRYHFDIPLLFIQYCYPVRIRKEKMKVNCIRYNYSTLTSLTLDLGFVSTIGWRTFVCSISSLAR